MINDWWILEKSALAIFIKSSGLLSYNMLSLYAGQEARVRTGHRTTDWFQIGKGVRQGCI